MKEKIKALALFSGGLDSALAIKLVQDQGVEVIALNFVSHFFGGKNEKAEKMAEQLGIKLEYIDFKKRHMFVVEDPVYGRGKNMNPCIDCHSLMFKIAGELLEEYGVLFYNQNEMGQTNSNMEGIEIEYPQNMTNKNSEENKYDNLDIKSLISKKPLLEKTVNQQTNDEDFDPLFPNVDFDSMTGLNKSKYDDLDFSALISKKPK